MRSVMRMCRSTFDMLVKQFESALVVANRAFQKFFRLILGGEARMRSTSASVMDADENARRNGIRTPMLPQCATIAREAPAGVRQKAQLAWLSPSPQTRDRRRLDARACRPSNDLTRSLLERLWRRPKGESTSTCVSSFRPASVSICETTQRAS